MTLRPQGEAAPSEVELPDVEPSVADPLVVPTEVVPSEAVPPVVESPDVVVSLEVVLSGVEATDVLSPAVMVSSDVEPQAFSNPVAFIMPCSLSWAAPWRARLKVTPAELMSSVSPDSDKVSLPVPPSSV